MDIPKFHWRTRAERTIVRLVRENARLQKELADMQCSEFMLRQSSATMSGQVAATVGGQQRAVYDPNADQTDPDVHADPRLPGGTRLEG